MCKGTKLESIANDYINIQTGEELDLERVSTLPDNAMLSKEPFLWVRWDFEKNDELDFDIWEMTKGSDKKVWWYCSFCNESFQMAIHQILEKIDIRYCPIEKIVHEKSLAVLNPQLASEWHPIKNGDLTPYDVTCGNSKKVWWISECGHYWESSIGSRNSGCKCHIAQIKKYGLDSMICGLQIPN